MTTNIRTITVGISPSSYTDLSILEDAIHQLQYLEQQLHDEGYSVQTLRIACDSIGTAQPNFPVTLSHHLFRDIDSLLSHHNVMLSLGQINTGPTCHSDTVPWIVELLSITSQIYCNMSIASSSQGIHHNTLPIAADICYKLGQKFNKGEGNFKFAVTTSMPANCPFFPAAYHRGPKSFSLGFELAGLVEETLKNSDWDNAEKNLIDSINQFLLPIEKLCLSYQQQSPWAYTGMDTSPAPGLNASIGQAIEHLSQKPFGESPTLSACGIITGALKKLAIKSCGYSGLMLPVTEDLVLAQRGMENRYSLKELLLFSTVCGTGLDVIPIPGFTTSTAISHLYRDVATLSLKYGSKPLSVRLLPIAKAEVNDIVNFDNPYLTTSKVFAVT
ncbi:DUF711 family protein [Membranihabitans marinus]|uniref:DUF711 family protein n=1 Tax=Membranihabitans marinus TaxID=1227546 RepID=UPI001F21CFB6|nr:DUF711 family protein [Membranihabitans marinus]